MPRVRAAKLLDHLTRAPYALVKWDEQKTGVDVDRGIEPTPSAFQADVHHTLGPRNGGG